MWTKNLTFCISPDYDKAGEHMVLAILDTFALVLAKLKIKTLLSKVFECILLLKWPMHTT